MQDSYISRYGKGTGKVKGEGKGKVQPITGHESPEVEYRYSSTLSITLAVGGGG
jgi:hypothetical protein